MGPASPWFNNEDVDVYILNLNQRKEQKPEN